MTDYAVFIGKELTDSDIFQKAESVQVFLVLRTVMVIYFCMKKEKQNQQDRTASVSSFGSCSPFLN